ncbi:DUF1983 domain-containing protein [Caldimonas thermodepolymerans]|uniref:Uncharacterized protein n=1 Tax=Caldimonas thermodepolymerans TaxID=215580 RepID=A0A2S5T978_9BURK|nr:phage tail fiber protein [Caldimonas thermodepolymerans]PPE71482.1 hypothetical protein C1702_00310 [Caldimonas thermodepolymerans]QPC30509.1 DUF1983 domain-containing protein [Caldimonas thermodepolymerans]RDI02905.1 carbohydrate binding protein [Caldimonas thermodepolymerans]
MRSEFNLPGSGPNYPVLWPYLERSHVIVLIDGTPWPFEWVSDTEIRVDFGADGVPPPGAKKLEIIRVTPDLESYAVIKDAANLDADQLNRMRRQLLYLLQERSGGIAGSVGNAITAASSQIESISNALADVNNVLATLTDNLATLDELRSEVTVAKNAATTARDAILSEIADNSDRFTVVNQRLVDLESGADELGSRITSEVLARSTEDSALSARIDQAYADFQTADGALSAAILDVDQARADGDAALASRVSALEASSGGVDPADFAQVQALAEATADALGNVQAQHVLKTVARSDGKQAVAGIGVAATASGDVAQSEIILMADKLLVVPPGAPDDPPNPIMAMGTVNGQPTTVFAANRFGDQSIGASVLVDGSITTRKLTVTGSNLIANSDFATGDLTNWRPWSAPALQAVVPATDADVPPGAPARYVCRFKLTPGTTSTHIAIFAADKAYSDAGADKDGFSVKPGEQYHVSIYAARSEDYAASGFSVIAYFYKTDGSWTTAASVLTAAPSALSSSTWTELKGSFEVPAGALRCWLYVRSTDTTAGGVYFTNLRCARMTDGDLIVQGAVKADHIDSRGLTIKDNEGNVIFGAGNALDWSRITGQPSGIYNSNISIAADGTLNGGGGGKVTYAGLGGKAMGLIDAITPSNVSTYIANAAIGVAQIANVLQSTNYAAGSAGWKIDKSGSMEINNLTARGNITANAVTANSITVNGLQPGAATNVVAVVDTGTVTSPSTTSTTMQWFTVVSATITTVGGKVALGIDVDPTFSLSKVAGSVGSLFCRARVLRNGSPIYTARQRRFDYSDSTVGTQTVDYPHAPAILVDTPSAGTHTYAVQLGYRSNGSPHAAYATANDRRGLSCMEFRR